MPLDTSSPKDRFRLSKDRIESHRSLLSHSQFEDSIDAAMAQFTYEMLSRIPENANDGAGRAFALAGAQQFVQTLRNLSELPDVPRPTLTRQLHQTT
jgi:hypothetical protein